MSASAPRLVAVDWLRGLVMVLMAIDHVDQATNPDHAQGDGAMFPGAGAVASEPDFLVRWLTHLCAPTFVLLAGVSIALSSQNAKARGASNFATDRHLIARGALIAFLDLTLLSLCWRYAEGMEPWSLTPVFPLVLWAIGGSIMLMPLFRRLPTGVVLGAAAALVLWSELTPPAVFGQPRSLLETVCLTGGLWWWELPPAGLPTVLCFYPLLTWLPVMLLGVVLGRLLAADRLTPKRVALFGVIALVVFLALRAGNEFGNKDLPRHSWTLVEWLHCSKYPPSLTFLGMELGLAFLILALLLKCETLLAKIPAANPLGVLGRVPMFYYLLHLPMIAVLMDRGALPGRGQGSWGTSLLGTLYVVAACWPLCLGYDWYKRRFRHAWTRYL